jgi:hypothetical protein
MEYKLYDPDNQKPQGPGLLGVILIILGMAFLAYAVVFNGCARRPNTSQLDPKNGLEAVNGFATGGHPTPASGFLFSSLSSETRASFTVAARTDLNAAQASRLRLNKPSEALRTVETQNIASLLSTTQEAL